MSAMQKLKQAVSDYDIHQPACPSCGKALRLSRITPGTSGLPDLRTYACRGPSGLVGACPIMRSHAR
jgi:hypothetical protein